MLNRSIAVLSVSILSIAAFTAAAEPITYQGSLSDGTGTASGTYDFVFRVWDAADGGAQQAPQLLANDVDVAQGLFTVELDFADGAFEGPRWLEILVKEDSAGSYTVLSPRQPLNAAPYAIEHLNEPWTETPDGIAFGGGDAKAFINRTGPLNINEFFGFTTPESAGYGGMYINAGGPGGLPFYGYAIGDLPQAWTQYDPATDEWQVNMRAPALTVDNSGNTTANSFRFRSPKTRYHSVQGSTATAPEQFRISSVFNSSWLQNPGIGFMTVPLHLPDGAALQNAVFYFTDNASGYLDFKIYQVTHATAATATIAAKTSTGALAGVQSFSSTVFDLINPGNDVVVDNQTYGYNLVVLSDNWPGDQTLNFVSVVIEYTVEEAD